MNCLVYMEEEYISWFNNGHTLTHVFSQTGDVLPGLHQAEQHERKEYDINSLAVLILRFYLSAFNESGDVKAMACSFNVIY